ncbi:hypothetical protein GQX73_g5689 [Xylaria multiplex]|uniref:Rab-GAP TBC domain-containing protein n=1 Tax=Xylaria multiplex TaxID=323545 RepID=A0A7C8IQS0_9PEZI|nr:hypothetical protein GQX73_g5689 [Xylaria multiplex]
MAVAQHADDEPLSLSEQHLSTRADTHATNSGSGVVLTSGSGPIRFPRREHSLNVRETGHSATRDWNLKHTQARSPTLPSPLPSHSPSMHPAHRQNFGGNIYDQRHYQSSNPITTPTYTTSNSIRDPRSRMGYPRDAPALSPQIPSPSISSRWDSLPKTSGVIYNPATTSAPTSPVALNFANELPYAANESYQSVDSVTSETRDEFPLLPSVRSNATENSMLVENFSRPRVLSIKQSSRDGSRLRSPTRPQPEPSQHDLSNPLAGAWPRSRDPSISSNKSASIFTPLTTRPSYESYNRDNPRPRARQPHPPPIRLPVSYTRPESSGHNSGRDPLPRMASLPNDELRSSFRSQLSASTAQGTLATERSSVLTKSSSVTSVYGNVDDSLSVDDVLGLYDKGFDDDSAPEDNDSNQSPPPTAMSESSKGATIELDVVTEVDAAIVVPPSVFTSDGPIVRDSAAIFRISNHQHTPSEDAAIQKERPNTADTEPNSPEEFTPSPPTRHETNLTTTGEEERDRYGFKKSNQYITGEEYDKWDSEYSKYLARRRKKWNVFLKENGLMTDTPNRFPPRSAKAKRFVRKGIPPDWRGAAWFYYAGGPAIVAKHAGLYDELLDCEVKEVDAEAIERDLHRTFPDNIKFRSSANLSTPAQDKASARNSQQTVTTSTAKNAALPGETAMISSLRRVLYAFSIYNPRIGYCQSLNFLAGLLLLFVESEEQAFWLLNIITRVYLPGTHEMSLEGANVDLGVLMSSIRDSMPNVWAKIGGELDGTDVARPKSRRHRQRAELTTRLPPITLCMTAWFMSCFIGTLPIESTLLGDPMEIFQVVQTIPRKMIDANGLMEACYKRRNGFGHLSQETIEQKRLERRKHVKAENERLALGESIMSADADVGRKATLFKRKPKDRN